MYICPGTASDCKDLKIFEIQIEMKSDFDRNLNYDQLKYLVFGKFSFTLN